MSPSSIPICAVFCQMLVLVSKITECTSTNTDKNALPRMASEKSGGLTKFKDIIEIIKKKVQAKKEEIYSQIADALFDECVRKVDAKEESMDKYIYLRKLQRDRPATFYKCLSGNVDKMMPIIYTPVVGKACKNYKRVVDSNTVVGLTLNVKDHRDNIEDMLEKRKENQQGVKVILVTDGERVLGLGDMGANGMGVLVGKLALFTALGGIHPRHCLAVTLDVGTNNKDFLESKKGNYVGKQMKRVTGEEYDAFIEKFIKAVVNVFGRTTLIQFEDFATRTAYPILKKYQNDYTVVNDDIQGTAAITIAGILSATKYRGTNINEAKVLFVGAGGAALGISTLMVDAMDGDPEENRKKIYMMDINGLLTSKYCPFKEGDQRRNFCHKIQEGRDTSTLEGIVAWVEPNILIDVSGAKGIFTKEVLQNMVRVNKKKLAKCLIMPLSTPHSKSECTAQVARTHAKGCLFVSGSPFAPVYVDEDTLRKEKTSKGSWFKNVVNYGQTFQPMQCNNDNIFPGVSLGIILAEMKRVPNHVFLIAAKTMADKCVLNSDLKKGNLYPQLKDLRECSVNVAAAVVKYAFEEDLSNLDLKPKGWEKWKLKKYKDFVREHQYKTVTGGFSFFKSKLQDLFKDKCVRDVDAKEESLDKYIYLRQLQIKKEAEFYKCLIRNVDKMLPIIYTPVVGKACKNYGKVVSEGGEMGLTLNIKDHKNRIVNILEEWKKIQKEVKAIVVTDGERILGLGDLGANGMGIPVGKLALYTALGGVHPKYCLPVTLDVGTDNKNLLGGKQERYVGKQMARVRGVEYWDFIEEFIQAVVKVYGQTTLIQFEDFANPTAYPLLKKYQDRYTVFNDDIQGTAAVAVAGILAAARFRGTEIEDAKVLFAGAGSAALGIANLIVEAMKGKPEDNQKKIFMKDMYGLLTSKKCGDPEFEEDDQKRNFCHKIEEGKNTEDLAEIILWLKPNVLIGVSGAKGIFTKEVLQNMAKVNENERPIIMPLSNPTSKSECTAKEALKYAKGCLFASGSPFAPVYVDEENLESEGSVTDSKKAGRKSLQPMQCNNDNIFPGVALGIILAKMKRVPNHVFLLAAETLAYKCLGQEDFDKGSLYPQPKDLRKCSVKVAAAVVEYAFKEKDLSNLNPKPPGWEKWTLKNYEKFVMKNQYYPK